MKHENKNKVTEYKSRIESKSLFLFPMGNSVMVALMAVCSIKKFKKTKKKKEKN